MEIPAYSVSKEVLLLMSWKRARLVIIAAAAVACAARADEIQPTPALPPTGGEYVLPTICLSNTTQGALRGERRYNRVLRHHEHICSRGGDRCNPFASR
jgi:hypothetical protein